jgi:hypothetical protein
MNSTYKLLCIFSISAICLPYLYSMEEKKDRANVFVININKESQLYTDATEEILKKIFHVLNVGTIPTDITDLTPGRAGRSPGHPLIKRTECSDLIISRMAEHFQTCKDSHTLTMQSLRNGKILHDEKFTTFVNRRLQQSPYAFDKIEKTNLKNLNLYLIEIAKNSYNKHVINAQAKELKRLRIAIHKNEK